MQPFDEDRKLTEDGARPKRPSAFAILAVVAVLVFVVIAVVLHLAGGVPTHGP